MPGIELEEMTLFSMIYWKRWFPENSCEMKVNWIIIFVYWKWVQNNKMVECPFGPTHSSSGRAGFRSFFVPLKPHLWTIQLCKHVCTNYCSPVVTVLLYVSGLRCSWPGTRSPVSGASHSPSARTELGTLAAWGLEFPYTTCGHITLRLLPVAWGVLLICFWLKRLSMTKSKKTAIEGKQSNICSIAWWSKSFSGRWEMWIWTAAGRE